MALTELPGLVFDICGGVDYEYLHSAVSDIYFDLQSCGRMFFLTLRVQGRLAGEVLSERAGGDWLMPLLLDAIHF